MKWFFGLGLVLVIYFGAKEFLLPRRVCFEEKCVRVEVADDEAERYRGLSGREKMAENQGMLFVFDKPDRYGFVMRGMKMGLDFVWIRDGRVVDITEKVEADFDGVLYPDEPVDRVLEVNSGWVERNLNYSN